MNQWQMPTRFVRETDVDVVLVAGRYSLLDQSAASELLPAAVARGVSVLAGGVFNSGILASPRAGATYDYAAAPDSLVARARALADICEAFGVPLRAAAARFPLRHPAVAGVLIGARSASEITDALSLRSLDIPEELWSSLAAAGVADAGAGPS
jgi:D-threo-aldose 1-dehydrogenase